MQHAEMRQSSTQIYISILAIYRMSFVICCILGMSQETRSLRSFPVYSNVERVGTTANELINYET
jgi:hypothetical protein